MHDAQNNQGNPTEGEEEEEDLARLAADLWRLELENFLQKDKIGLHARRSKEMLAASLRAFAEGFSFAAAMIEILAKEQDESTKPASPDQTEAASNRTRSYDSNEKIRPRPATATQKPVSALDGDDESPARLGELGRLGDRLAMVERQLALLEDRFKTSSRLRERSRSRSTPG